MTLYIDADGCPVVNETIQIAREYGIEVVLICDSAHVFTRDGARTITVQKGADSADFRLVNLLSPGDIVITQDYGLAAMCLARRARVINQNGLRFTDANIDSLLSSRHESRKIRMAGGRTKGPKKRAPHQTEAYISALRALIEDIYGSV